MGCCSFNHEEILGGLILPDLEQQIQQAEALHPFSQIQASTLFSQLSKFRKTKQISKHLFEIIMRRLKIITKPFYNPKHPLFYYSRGITNHYKYFDMNKLLLTASLLAKAQLKQKLKFLFKIYSEEQSVSESRMRSMLQGMADISINVLPRMLRIDRVLKQYSQYIDRLKLHIPQLVDSIIILMNKKTVFWTLQQFQEFFYQYPDFQKVFWSQGIRIMAIEKDIKSVLPKAKLVEKTKELNTGIDQSKIEDKLANEETRRYTARCSTDLTKTMNRSDVVEERIENISPFPLFQENKDKSNY